jgi:hypothetical protein
MGDEELLTIAKVAEETGYTARRLRQFAERGDLPAKLYGRTYLVERGDLRRFLAGHHPTTGRPRGSRNRKQPTPPHASG